MNRNIGRQAWAAYPSPLYHIHVASALFSHICLPLTQECGINQFLSPSCLVAQANSDFFIISPAFQALNLIRVKEEPKHLILKEE